MEVQATTEDYVQLRVCDPQAQLLFAGVWQKGNRIAITAPYQKAAVYRTLAQLAGCKLWTDGGITLWADQRMLGVFTLEKLHGTLTLPHPGTYREVISGKTYRNVSQICLDEQNANAAVFVPVT